MNISSTCISKFDRVIRNIAGCVMRKVSCDIDPLAYDVDDYESILTVRAWQALTRWRSDPKRVAQGQKAEHKYVCTALWREARGQEKRRVRPKYNIDRVPFFDNDLVDDTFEWRLVARDSLNTAGNELDNESRAAFGQAIHQGVVARGRFVADCQGDRELFKKYSSARAQLAQSVPSALMLTEG